MFFPNSVVNHKKGRNNTVSTVPKGQEEPSYMTPVLTLPLSPVHDSSHILSSLGSTLIPLKISLKQANHLGQTMVCVLQTNPQQVLWSSALGCSQISSFYRNWDFQWFIGFNIWILPKEDIPGKKTGKQDFCERGFWSCFCKSQPHRRSHAATRAPL